LILLDKTELESLIENVTLQDEETKLKKAHKAREYIVKNYSVDIRANMIASILK